jgi:hypothetical protein
MADEGKVIGSVETRSTVSAREVLLYVDPTIEFPSGRLRLS